MSTDAENENSTPTPQELRARVEGTREELAQTVQALAAKADVKARTKNRTAQVKADVVDSVAAAGAQAKEGIAQAAHLAQESVLGPLREGGAAVVAKVRDKTPEPVAQGAGQATNVVRQRPDLLIASAVSAVAVFFLLRKLVRR